VQFNLDKISVSASWKILLRLIGPLLLVLILGSMDRQKLLDTLIGVRWQYIFFGLFISIFIPALRAFRWFLINHSLSIHISFYKCLYLVFTSLPFGLLTPGRVGMEFYRFMILRSTNYPSVSIATGIVLDRLSDLFAIGIVFVAGIGYLNLPEQSSYIFIARLFLLSISALMILYLLKKRFIDKIRNYITLKYLQRVTSHSRDNLNNNSQIHFSTSLILIIITVSFLINIVCALQVYSFSLSLGTKVSFGFLNWCVSAMIISNLFPIAFLGIGTRDVTLIYFLSLVDVIPQTSVSISSFVLAALIFHSIIGSIFLLFPIAKRDFNTKMNE
jgi:uncharacterized protein (TIRG00374 family)